MIIQLICRPVLRQYPSHWDRYDVQLSAQSINLFKPPSLHMLRARNKCSVTYHVPHTADDTPTTLSRVVCSSCLKFELVSLVRSTNMICRKFEKWLENIEGLLLWVNFPELWFLHARIPSSLSKQWFSFRQILLSFRGTTKCQIKESVYLCSPTFGRTGSDGRRHRREANSVIRASGKRWMLSPAVMEPVLCRRCIFDWFAGLGLKLGSDTRWRCPGVRSLLFMLCTDPLWGVAVGDIKTPAGCGPTPVPLLGLLCCCWLGIGASEPRDIGSDFPFVWSRRRWWIAMFSGTFVGISFRRLFPNNVKKTQTQRRKQVIRLQLEDVDLPVLAIKA